MRRSAPPGAWLMRLGALSLGDHLADPTTGEKTSVAQRHAQIVDLAVQAEALHFDLFAVGEHHHCDYILSSPPVVLGAVAGRTTRIRLGTGTTLLPTLDPIRAAEDYATLDAVSNGRVELVVGRGIIQRTYPDFGRRYEDSQALMDEATELLLRVWSEEAVTATPRFRSPLRDVTVHPRPVQKPHPPVWIGGSQRASVDLAARLGLGLMLPSVISPPDAFAPIVARYRDAFVDRGRGGPVVGCVSHTHVGGDTETARRRWRPYYQSYLEWVGRDLFPWGALSPLSGDLPLPDFETVFEKGPALCGSADQVSERMLSIADAIEPDLWIVHADPGGLPAPLVHESLERFALGVMPHLRNR